MYSINFRAAFQMHSGPTNIFREMLYVKSMLVQSTKINTSYFHILLINAITVMHF